LAIDLEELRRTRRGAGGAGDGAGASIFTFSPIAKWLIGIVIVLGVLWLTDNSDKKKAPAKAPPAPAAAPAAVAPKARDAETAGVSTQSLLTQLADSHRGVPEINENTTSNRDLYSKAIASLNSKISKSTRTDHIALGGFSYSGVSIKPLTAIYFVQGLNNCRQKFNVVRMCVQSEVGLFCDNENLDNNSSRDFCIVGFIK
jgi:hypothetical protein